MYTLWLKYHPFKYTIAINLNDWSALYVQLWARYNKYARLFCKMFLQVLVFLYKVVLNI